MRSLVDENLPGEVASLLRARGFDVLDVAASPHAVRVSGTSQPHILEEPDRLRYVSSPRRPSETAYALAKQRDNSWRFLGVARHHDDDERWHLPHVDYTTWRTWGAGRDVSRRLSEQALSRAQLAVDALLSSHKRLPVFPPHWLRYCIAMSSMQLSNSSRRGCGRCRSCFRRARLIAGESHKNWERVLFCIYTFSGHAVASSGTSM